jgi:predicted DNA-binding protein (MmcQ/YjbR family)
MRIKVTTLSASVLQYQPGMTRDSIRSFCLKLPQTTEHLQWGDALVFKIAGKMFAVVNLGETGETSLAFKCSPEEFAALTELEDIIPAPYLARAHWVSLGRLDALALAELKKRLRDSYDLVVSRLPKKVRAGLEGPSR